MEIVHLSTLLESDPNVCKKFSRYKKKSGQITYVIYGLELEKGYIHEPISTNQFKINATKIPEGYKKYNSKYSHWCDPNKTLIKPNNPEFSAIEKATVGYKMYYTLDNGSEPFLVYVNDENALVYRIPENRYYQDNDYKSPLKHHLYVDCVAVFDYKRLLIGTSPQTIYTTFSGGYGPRFDGNSILLHIENNDYVFIGDCIYRFKTPKDDVIEKYYSTVGNSWVPYPIAIGKKNIYFMLDLTSVSNEYFKDFSLENKIDGYSYYYGHEGPEPLSKYAINLDSVIIQKRLI